MSASGSRGENSDAASARTPSSRDDGDMSDRLESDAEGRAESRAASLSRSDDSRPASRDSRDSKYSRARSGSRAASRESGAESRDSQDSLDSRAGGSDKYAKSRGSPVREDTGYGRENGSVRSEERDDGGDVRDDGGEEREVSDEGRDGRAEEEQQRSPEPEIRLEADAEDDVDAEEELEAEAEPEGEPAADNEVLQHEKPINPFGAPDVPLGRPKRQRRRPQRWEGTPTSTDARRTPRRNSAASSPHGSGGGGQALAGGVLALLQPNGGRRGSRGSFGSGGGGSGGGGHAGRSYGLGNESTVSVDSVETGSPPPEGIDPLDSLESALERAREAPGGNQGVVEAFHAWQLKAVSAESNYQKNLHAHLRRNLRKRANRMLDRERLEEDAVRNACSAPGPCMEGEETAASGDLDSEGEDGGSAKRFKKLDTDAVPNKIRLPLEAYLPKRVRKADGCATVDGLLEKLLPPPNGGLRTWGETDDESSDSGGAEDSGTVDSSAGSAEEMEDGDD